MYKGKLLPRRPRGGVQVQLYSFFNFGAMCGWVVNATLRPFHRLEREAVPIQEAGWAPGPLWTGAKNLAPTGSRSPDRPARSGSPYRLRCPGVRFVCSVTYRARLGCPPSLPSVSTEGVLPSQLTDWREHLTITISVVFKVKKYWIQTSSVLYFILAVVHTFTFTYCVQETQTP